MLAFLIGFGFGAMEVLIIGVILLLMIGLPLLAVVFVLLKNKTAQTPPQHVCHSCAAPYYGPQSECPHCGITQN